MPRTTKEKQKKVEEFRGRTLLGKVVRPFQALKGVGRDLGIPDPEDRLNPRKQAKQLLLDDLKAMEEGELGLSAAEKGQIVSQAQEEAGATLRAQQADLARQGLQLGGAARGEAAKAQRGVAAEAAEIGAKARLSAEQLSEQVAQSREQQIRAELQRQEAIQRQNRAFWRAQAVKLATAGFAAGVPGAGKALGLSQEAQDAATKQLLEG
jgi:hypothetical protein